MKIVYIINSLKSGGPVNMLFSLVKYLDKNQFEVTVIALSPCEVDSKIDFRMPNVNIIECKNNRFKKQIKEVQGYIDIVRPSIVHSHGGIADYINTKIKGDYEHVSTVHCEPFNEFVMKKGLVLGTIKACVFVHNLSKIDHPIACSSTVAENINRKGIIKARYIRNGIDLEKKTDLPSECKKKFGINENDIVLVFCGFLSKRKNVQYIITALKKLNNEKIKLLIIGDGEQMNYLKTLSDNDKRIIFVGKVNNPFLYYGVCDYVISASRSEGLPLSVMECMSCGLPAILSNIDSHKEIKACCGEGVSLFSLNDIFELVDILRNIKKPDSLRGEVRSCIYNKFNAKRMSEEYSNLYYELGKD